MRVERFKMEREGLVTEGQEVEISERSAVTGQYTYLVEPSMLCQESTVPDSGSEQEKERSRRLNRRTGDFICLWRLTSKGRRNKRPVVDTEEKSTYNL